MEDFEFVVRNKLSQVKDDRTCFLLAKIIDAAAPIYPRKGAMAGHESIRELICLV